MNKIIYSLVFIILITILHTGCSGGPHGGSYRIFAHNISQQGNHGVILIEPTFDKGQPIQLDLRLPGDSGTKLVQFRKKPKFPTDELKVVWQLAALSDCSYEYISRVNPKNKRIAGCTFTPIPGKIYSKTIDMTEIYNSEAGKVAYYFPGNSDYYILYITLLFNNDQLDVTWGTSQTNSWK